MDSMRVKARRSNWNVSVDLLFYTQNFNTAENAMGLAAIAEPLVMRPVEKGELVSEPTVQLTMESAQALMDELWFCGIRPAEAKGSAGELKAVEYHLEDMRRLVFKESRGENPK